MIERQPAVDDASRELATVTRLVPRGPAIHCYHCPAQFGDAVAAAEHGYRAGHVIVMDYRRPRS
jgi:hypothetical protein